MNFFQDQERARNSQRLTNNRIRLKDIKNEFNQTQSTLSKCLSNVHSNIQVLFKIQFILTNNTKN